MRNHTGSIRGYYRASKAWYAKPTSPIEVNFGMYDPNGEGGTSGEMTMEWEEFKLNREFVPRLKCYHDGWSALSLFDDLIQKLGDVDPGSITEKEFCKILDSCGFKDLTKYKKD